MNNRKFVSAVAITLTVAAACASAPFVNVAKETYKFKSTSAAYKANCQLCHVARLPAEKNHELNPYGKALKKVLKAKAPHDKKYVLTAKDMARIEALDSDKDGVKNGVELRAGTLPGDPHSK